MEKNFVAEKIAALLDAKKIGIDDLAERSGLSMAQIELLLKSDDIPSLAPLIKIARGLGVRLGTLLDDNEWHGPAICRANEQHATFSSQMTNANSHLDFFSMAGNKAGRHFEPFMIDVKPNNTTKVLSSHEGEEFLYVLSGSVRIDYGKQVYELTQGDSIYYDSIVNHLVSAANDEPARILAIVYTPF